MPFVQTGFQSINGFIKFGSRVDLLLPLDTKLEVGLNQKVVGKQTIIGRFA